MGLSSKYLLGKRELQPGSRVRACGWKITTVETSGVRQIRGIRHQLADGGGKEPLDMEGDRKLSVGVVLVRRTSGFLPKLDNAKRSTEISLGEKFQGA